MYIAEFQLLHFYHLYTVICIYIYFQFCFCFILFSSLNNGTCKPNYHHSSGACIKLYIFLINLRLIWWILANLSNMSTVLLFACDTCRSWSWGYWQQGRGDIWRKVICQLLWLFEHAISTYLTMPCWCNYVLVNVKFKQFGQRTVIFYWKMSIALADRHQFYEILLRFSDFLCVMHYVPVYSGTVCMWC